MQEDEKSALLDEIHRRIGQRVQGRRPLTPLQHSPGLSAALNCNVLLKCEHLAPTGSFKYRGASLKLSRLGSDAAAGVVTASTGNHGKAVAKAAQECGVAVTVFAPAGADTTKLDSIRALGAAVVVVDGDALDAESAARRQAIAAGMPYISPYNDLDMIAGSATIATEVIEQAPQTDAIFVSVGGGGLLSGVGVGAKTLKPEVRIVGCWPSNADSLYQVLFEKTAPPRPETATLSDATMGGAEEGSVTIPLCSSVLDAAVRVSEAEIREAMRLVFDHTGHVIEGAAAVALAGLAQSAAEFSRSDVVIVLCGGNVDRGAFQRAVSS